MFDVNSIDERMINAIARDPKTVRRILETAELVTMEGVGKQVGISYYRVKILRGRRIQIETEESGGIPRSDALPPSMPLPGDPLWHPVEIDVWGRQTGRLDQDGNPRRAQPTGRPRQSSTQRSAKAALAEERSRIREEQRAAKAQERSRIREEQRAAKAEERARIREEQRAAKAETTDSNVNNS